MKYFAVFMDVIVSAFAFLINRAMEDSMINILFWMVLVCNGLNAISIILESEKNKEK